MEKSSGSKNSIIPHLINKDGSWGPMRSLSLLRRVFLGHDLFNQQRFRQQLIRHYPSLILYFIRCIPIILRLLLFLLHQPLLFDPDTLPIHLARLPFPLPLASQMPRIRCEQHWIPDPQIHRHIPTFLFASPLDMSATSV
jgi:hypothetical protein